MLGSVAYMMVVDTMRLQQTWWGNLNWIILVLGTYAGHASYKAANKGLMTYSQGLQLGLILHAFMTLVSFLPLYLCIKFINPATLMQWVKENVRHPQMEKMMAKIIERFPGTLSVESVCIALCIGSILAGFMITLIVAAFSRYPKESTKNT